MKKNSQKRRSMKSDAEAVSDSKGGNSSPVIVVGIGTSAGGLKSLKQLFAKMPTRRGMAFVLVSHLKPKRKSLAVKLLADQTALSVVEAKDGMPVLADRIHVIPPDKYLSIDKNILTVREPVLCNSLWMPIDHFFCSLALDQRSRGVGILLSGMGSDGTLGLSEIRAAGGKTFVEDPDSAEFPGMPQSAIDAGTADTVLPAKAMAEAITALADKVTAGTRSAQTYPPEFDSDVRAILDILRAKVGHDFQCYKPNTIIRRIRRRMGLARISTFADYARFMHAHTKEVGLLQKDLLIGVTDFFRQPQAWETLEEKIIIPLVDNAHPGSEIRVWVPGCSTGQEAYSLAMLLTEHVEKSGNNPTVQIFATDSDLTALATARSGIYSKEVVGESVSSGRLKRFFLRKDGHYQVVKDIREQIVFAAQNITTDPPFSRLDLISCRNLLIYLDQKVQKKIIALFHFSLREGGFIFLGTAETVGDRSDLFEPVSKKWRIYRRIGVGHHINVEIPMRPTGAPLPVESSDSGRGVVKRPLAVPPSRMSLASSAQHMLLDRFAPACVMIDRKLQVLYVHGAAEDYLTFPPGELTTHIVDMAREGLRARLRGAITKCLETNKSVSVNARVRRGKKSVPVKVIVSSLRYPREIDGLLLITFEDYLLPVAKSSRQAVSESSIRQLEDELKLTREELHSTIEQLENSNDQFKASNEEVMAANEELQAANEELETSKEELQSLNEELNTINTRLEEKVEELEGVNNDVVNLLSSTNIATVFLDKELRVKRYTPAITRLLSLIPTDAGRPFADILRRFTDERLLDDARRVLADLTPLDSEVQGDDGRWYMRRITPYRTHDDRIEGVVITFVDVTERKEAEGALRKSEQHYRTVADFTYNWEFWVSPEGRFHYVSPSAERIIGRHVSPNVCADELFRQIAHPEDLEKRLEHLQEELAGRGPCEMEYRILRPDGEVRWVHHVCQPIHDADGRFLGTRGSNRDITERKSMDEALSESRHRLAVIVDSIADGFYALDREWRFIHINDAALLHMGKTGEEILGRTLFDIFPEARGSVIETEYGIAMKGGEPRHFENPSLISGRILEIHAYPGRDNLTILFRDVTEQNRMAAALRKARDRAEWLARFPNENPNPVMRVLADGNVLYCNPATAEISGWACEVGQQLPDLLLPLLGQAMAAGQEMEQDVEMGGRFYSVAVVPIPEGGYANIYGRDITERKRAEDALRESEARFRLLSATAGRLLSSDDPQAIVEDLCRDVMAYLDCQAFFNFLVDEKAGRLRLNACAGIPDEDGRTIEWLDYGVAVCGCVAQARHRIIAEDIFHTPDIRTDLVKSYGIQAYCCHPLMAQDRLIGTLSFGTKTRPHFTPDEVKLMRLVTDQVAVAMQRKQAADDLQKAKDDLEERVQERTAELKSASLYARSLIEASLDPLVTISQEGKITDVNKSTEIVTGRTKKELIGTDFSDYFTEPERARAGYEQVFKEGFVKDYPLAIRHSMGDLTEVLYNASIYRDESGAVKGVFAAARDVTELHRIQEALQESHGELELRVKERTAELQERSEQLQAANKELESFSYSVSHDLRAPLRAIDGYARSILKKQEDKFDEDTKRRFNDIRLNARMMGQLIDDLLAFSRLGKKQMSMAKLDMDAFMMDVWKELQTANPERQMKLTLNSMPSGYGDRTLIKQICLNLLSNAIKFTKLCDPAHIEAGGYTEGNEDVYYIKDNGVGFDMAYYDKLFGVFQRLHNHDDFEGTGVGLATVQRIIHRHEGRVWAEGKVNEGATFYFSLPRKG